MTKDAPRDPGDTGTIVFVEHHEPPLLAGEYAVTVQQALSNADCTDPKAPEFIGESHSRTRRFSVAGPRFALDPTDLNTLFPPPNNRGEYQNCLAHVVLNGRTLPWVRSTGAGGRGTTWLAVFLFDELDPPPPIEARHVSDLIGDPKNGVASYGDAYRIAGAEFEPDYGESLSDPCQTIDVPVTLFNTIAPSLSDLAWLAHSRSVDSAAKAGQPPASRVDLGVVIGNRLPASGRRSTAHLVSLEEMGAFLPGPDYRPATIRCADSTAAKAVRLVSLANWSFAAIEPKESFQGYLEHASVGTLQRVFSGATPTGPAAGVPNAFAMGYTAMDHHTRLGDKTASWYRGPFVPFQSSGRTTIPLPDPDATPPSDGPTSADALVRYDPGTQMMDVSYAAAWQLGRLLALQDSAFAVALYNWKRGLALKTAASIERQILDGFSPSPEIAAEAATRTHVVALHAAASVVTSTLGRPLTAPVHTGKRRTPIFRRATVFAKTVDLVSNRARLARIHADTPVPPDIARWLGRLQLLYGVPFHYLVPDEAMLPAESIRFFQLDVNWTHALVEGALSIAQATSSDVAHDATLSPKVHAAARLAARRLRTPHAADGPVTHVSGLLLRSAAVSGWPGLEVRAFDEGGTSLGPVLRMDRLAPDLLLFMVSGVLGKVQIQEPAEGIHFGVDAKAGDKSLRYVTVPKDVSGKRPGDQIEDAPSVVPPLRGNGVFAVTSLTTALEAAVTAARGISGPFTAAEFALEMVEGVQAVVFKRV